MRFISVLTDANKKQSVPSIKYVESLGAAFQIQDDIIAVASEEYAKERGVGEDIREGKRSLMVIHTMSKCDKSSQRLEHILNLQTNDETLLKEAINILKDNGSVEYAKKRAGEILGEAWLDLEKVLPESKVKKNIEELS